MTMPISPRLPPDASLASPAAGHVLVAFLDQGRYLDRTGNVLLFLTVLAMLVPLPVRTIHPLALCGLAAALACGLAQKYYALRVRIDAALFRQLYQDGPAEAGRLRQLDEGLAGVLGQVPKADAGSRPLADRWRGAMRLWRRQLSLCAIQAILFAAVVACMLLPARG